MPHANMESDLPIKCNHLLNKVKSELIWKFRLGDQGKVELIVLLGCFTDLCLNHVIVTMMGSG